MQNRKSVLKKILNKLSFTLSMVLLMVFVFPCVAYANEIPRIEQVQSVRPEITSYIYSELELTSDNVQEAYLGDEKLEIVSFEKFNPNSEKSLYLFLVDCSTSITQAQMTEIKKTLNEFIDSKNDNINVTLISFGEKIDILADNENDKDLLKDAVSKLERNQKGTVFYDALIKAIDITSVSSPDIPTRKLAFIFSDSVDYNLGGHSKTETENKIFSASLPFYAVALDNGTKSVIDDFGTLARGSGGQIAVVNPKNMKENVFELISSTDDCYKVSMKTKNNIVTKSKKTFSLAIESGGNVFLSERFVNDNLWIKDEISPVVESLEIVSFSTIKLVFSEEVLNAGNKENYIIKDSENNFYSVKTAVYDDSETAALITFDESLTDGKYVVSTQRITDASMEKNPLNYSEEINITGNPKETKAPESNEKFSGETNQKSPIEINVNQGEAKKISYGPLLAISLFTILIVVIILVIAFSVIRKRKGVVLSEGKVVFQDNVEVVEEKVQIHSVSTAVSELNLRIIDQRNNTSDITIKMNKSIFVGRANICDIVFDDAEMSRQHFVLEELDNGVFITNLSTTNGTLLNGVPVLEPRIIFPNDRIDAGKHTLIYLSLNKI